MPDDHGYLLNGQRLIHLAETGSTNSEALRRAFAGESPPFWVLADRQTDGRGRSGRKWSSIEGNLFASCLVRLELPAPRAFQMSLVAGLALYDAVRAHAPAALPLRLKWPNDLLIGSAKTGGILIESTQGRRGMEVVIGIGLNIQDHPRDIPAQVTHLRQYGDFPEPRRFLDGLAAVMARWFENWRGGEGFDAIRAAWLDRAVPAGEPISINAGDGLISGRFKGLDSEGALLLIDQEGREHRYTVGDVTLIPGG